MGLHELVADLALDFVDVGFRLVLRDFKQQLPGQRIAIGVQAGGRQAKNNVAGLDGFAGDDLSALDHADNESGKIIFALGIEARHLRGLAADECAAIVFAGFRQSLDHFFGDRAVEFARGEVIHEEHGRGALHCNIVDAVIHQIGADRVMNVHLEGQFELRANAVHARNQHWIEILCLVHRKQAAEAANLAEHALGERLMRQILDALLGPVSLIYVDARVCVSDRFGRMLGHGVSGCKCAGA